MRVLYASHNKQPPSEIPTPPSLSEANDAELEQLVQAEDRAIMRDSERMEVVIAQLDTAARHSAETAFNLAAFHNELNAEAEKWTRNRSRLVLLADELGDLPRGLFMSWLAGRLCAMHWNLASADDEWNAMQRQRARERRLRRERRARRMRQRDLALERNEMQRTVKGLRTAYALRQVFGGELETEVYEMEDGRREMTVALRGGYLNTAV